jgi:hypothetical protein
MLIEVFVTLILAGTVAGWFSLEAEASGRSKFGWITLGVFAYLGPMLVWRVILAVVVVVTGSEASPVLAWVAAICAHAIGVLSASVLRWIVSRDTTLTLRPPRMVIGLVVLSHVAFVLFA